MRKHQILFVISFFFISFLQGQSYFADKCIGIWKGKLYIFRQGQLRDSVTIQLSVTRIKDKDSWMCKTEYYSTTMPMTKDYIFLLKDTARQCMLPMKEVV